MSQQQRLYYFLKLFDNVLARLRSKSKIPQDKHLAHPELGEVLLRWNARAKRLTLSVRANGELRITLPKSATQSQALRMLEAKKEWILAAQKRMLQRAATAPTPFSEAEIKQMREAAKIHLPLLTSKLAASHGFKYRSLKISSARSKWGSCKSDNSIILSLFLMALPEHLREFVILHELCHTVHHNHSANFYALLDKHCAGRERSLNAELRQYSTAGRK